MKKEINIYEGKCNIDGVLDEINLIDSETDDILFFNSGTKADFVKKQNVMDERYKNYFGIYNKNIFLILRKIKEVLKDYCFKYEINYEKTFYYISSEYLEKVNSKSWSDNGGEKIPYFSCIIVLDCQENSSIIIGEKDIKVESGSLLFFESGNKIKYNNDNTSILSCNISPLSMIKNQYPQKWIPIV